MHPILRDYIEGDKGGFFELIQAIAAHTDNRSAIQIHELGADKPAQDVRTYQKRTRAKDVIQTRRGFVRFIY